MQYEQNTGGWVSADDLNSGDKIAFVTECQLQEGKFKDKEGNLRKENVVKVRGQGWEESKNMRVNWTTINGLVDAFGKESKDWVKQILTVEKREMIVGDTVRDVVYLIPEGYHLIKNEEKKLVIRKAGSVETPKEEVKSEPAPQQQAPKADAIEYPEEEINPDDIPF